MSVWIVKPIFNEDGFLIGYEKTGEVVRCRDCKYASPNGKIGCQLMPFSCHDKKRSLYADGFCSCGDRKDEPQTECTGCRFVGTYDTQFPCANCARKTKDYYKPQTERSE